MKTMDAPVGSLVVVNRHAQLWSNWDSADVERLSDVVTGTYCIALCYDELKIDAESAHLLGAYVITTTGSLGWIRVDRLDVCLELAAGEKCLTYV